MMQTLSVALPLHAKTIMVTGKAADLQDAPITIGLDTVLLDKEYIIAINNQHFYGGGFMSP